MACEITGVSGRAMLEALIAGQRDPAVLADLAQRQLRKKIPALTEALQGRFNNHHAFMVRLYLDRIDAHEADIARLDARIEEAIAPFRATRELLVSIPGWSQVVADVFIAETGADMNVFPAPGQLASWAGVMPSCNESAGRVKSAKTLPGNRHLKAALGIAALSASRSTNTYFGARFRRIAGAPSYTTRNQEIAPPVRRRADRHRCARTQDAHLTPGTCSSTAPSTKTPAPTTTPDTTQQKPKPEPSNNSKPSDTTSHSNPTPTPPNTSHQPTHQLLVTLNFRMSRAKSRP